MQGESHHVVVAPLDAGDEGSSFALDAVGSSLVHWIPCIHVGLDERFTEHGHVAHGGFREGLHIGCSARGGVHQFGRHDGHSGVHTMCFPRQHHQHLLGLFYIHWFLQHLSSGRFHHGVCTHHHVWTFFRIFSPGHLRRLSQGRLLRIFACAWEPSCVEVFFEVRRHRVERHVERVQYLFSSWRSRRQHHAHVLQLREHVQDHPWLRRGWMSTAHSTTTTRVNECNGHVVGMHGGCETTCVRAAREGWNMHRSRPSPLQGIAWAGAVGTCIGRGCASRGRWWHCVALRRFAPPFRGEVCAPIAHGRKEC
mmetsp:Transcript_6961/g.42598  ORF Transcript_6961/g.42598 Transcript_6961/m.42598 type:complete len:309 (+) Transcript_6961:1489-2415(+)